MTNSVNFNDGATISITSRANGMNRTNYNTYGGAEQDTISRAMPSTRAKTISDPEGVNALSDINAFEKRCAKKPNRYPKSSLEAHFQLEETMKKKIRLRAELT